MNGPQHYVEAERLLEGWQMTVDGLSDDLTVTELHQQIELAAALTAQSLAAAQIHATLALAAAAGVSATYANGSAAFIPGSYGTSS